MRNRINIVIPMAGLGVRFLNEGYNTPKPFIPIGDKTMIEHVINNLSCENHKFTLIAHASHKIRYQNIFNTLQQDYNLEIIFLTRRTLGPTCTVLAAHNNFNNDEHLLIANCDQLVSINIDNFINDALDRKLHGSILVFNSNSPAWSYVKLDEQNLIYEIKEKEVISDLATVGIYFYTKGEYFISAALDMIAQTDMCKQEFYVCPAYNYLLQNYNMKIGVFKIKSQNMHSLGTPQDFEKYLTCNV